jgi:hypothetical protein
MGPTSSVGTLLPVVCQRSGSIAWSPGKANLFSRSIRGGRWQNRGVAQPLLEQVEKPRNRLEDKAAFARWGRYSRLSMSLTSAGSSAGTSVSCRRPAISSTAPAPKKRARITMRLGLGICPCNVVKIVPVAMPAPVASCHWLRPRSRKRSLT